MAEEKRSITVFPAQAFDGSQFGIALSSTKIAGCGPSIDIYLGETVDFDGPRWVIVKMSSNQPDDVQRKLLLRELQSARQLSGSHPLILPFIGVASIGPRFGIVSPYMKNGNLLDFTKRNMNADIKNLILKVAEGLEHLHRVAGLVHGDIKCSNVLISEFGEALLADFGLSTSVKKALFGPTTPDGAREMYTTRFAAPELLLGAATPANQANSKTRESDVFAFGMLILEATTGRRPWSDLNDFAVIHRVCSGQVPLRPRLLDYVAYISHSWWTLCLGCWNFEPRYRPTIQSLLRDLTPKGLLPRRIMRGHASTVWSVSYTPCGRRIISCSADKTAQMWDVAGGFAIGGPLNLHTDEVNAVAVLRDGRQFATGSDDFTLRRWDAISGACLGAAMEGHAGYVLCVAYSPDGARIASGSTDCTVRFWSAATGEPLKEPLEGHEFPVYSLAFSPDGALLASASYEEIRLWDTATNCLVGVLCTDAIVSPLHKVRRAMGTVYSICFSPDGKHLVAGSDDPAVRIWDVTERKVVRVLRGSSKAEPVFCLAISPAGGYIAYVAISHMGDDDGDEDSDATTLCAQAPPGAPRKRKNDGAAIAVHEVRIWSLSTVEQNMPPLRGHEDAVCSVTFSPDGRSVASGSRDGTVRVWELFE